MQMTDFPAGGYVADYLIFWAVWIAIVAGTWFFFRRTRGRTGLKRLVAGNLLVLLSLLFTVVLAAETYLRYVYDASDQYAGSSGRSETSDVRRPSVRKTA